ncbi:AraC family transcriptional regulator [Kiritimatiella glycovorans]|uniref:AraC family transcriptional regulator n=1 Tax=Kiritimatiella glycovorans TaxID=1307763 RepID=A0A0G3EDJ2_9BACT|nr:AraC family transcriptional regulator [Kiritimatiella glycovorans]AKJ64383.1 AraC family transcriptional regulator [Kiritimatiella glycovorans]
MDGYRTFHALLDLLPDVAFFMKDRKGRFVMHNRRACEYCRAASEQETLGRTDFDFWDEDRARSYVEGDRRVMETGTPIINAIALAPEEAGSDRLIIYSKVPVRDRRGRVIGVAGIHREIEGRHTPASYDQINRAVQAIHERYREPIKTRELAGIAGLSTSQFDRRFRKLFGTTPREYLLRVRVNAACRMLEDADRTITDIAMSCGFYDHSHLSRTFRRIMGTAPSKYRDLHAPS